MLLNLLNIKSFKAKFVLIVLLILFTKNTRSQGLYWDPIDTVKYSKYSDRNREIKCIDSNICIKLMSDNGIQGAILQLTTDGGSSWDNIFVDTIFLIEPQKYYNPPIYHALSFTPPANIILSGDSGTVWKSNDMGKSWEKENNEKNHIITYRMFDSNRGLKFFNIKNTLLLKISVTYNGGKDWFELNSPDYFKWDLIFVNGITPSGNIYFYTMNEDDGYRLYWVLDSGKTWNHIDYGNVTGFNDVKFANNNTGFAVRYDKTDSNITKQVILKTVDAGETWYKVLDRNDKYGGLYNIAFYDENNILVTGFYTTWIFRTTDGGSNWIEDRVTGMDDKANFISISDIVFCGPKCGYIATSDILFKLSDKPVTSVGDGIIQNSNSININHSIIIDKNEPVKLSLTNDFSKDINIRMFDFLGSLVSALYKDNIQIENNILNISTTGLSSGLYFINISNGFQSECIKLLIR